MKGGDWILCEHSTRWVAALRTALRRQQLSMREPRIYEVRHLSDLSTEIALRPDGYFMIEVDAATLPDILELLAAAIPRHPRASFSALLSAELAESTADRKLAIEALFESGVDAIAVSPRQLGEVLAVGRRHGELLAAKGSQSRQIPLQEWAWELLPWQGK
jgi:hypothetical protein